MANECELSNGWELVCTSIGGIEKVYLSTYTDDSTYTLGTSSEVTGATNAGTYYAFNQDTGFSSLNQTMNASLENGTVYYDSVLSLKFVGLNSELRNTFLALAKAPLVAIIKSNAGEHYILGVQNAGRASAGSLSLGQNLGDHNGGTVELTWSSQDGAFLLDESIIGTDIIIS